MIEQFKSTGKFTGGFFCAFFYFEHIHIVPGLWGDIYGWLKYNC